MPVSPAPTPVPGKIMHVLTAALVLPLFLPVVLALAFWPGGPAAAQTEPGTEASETKKKYAVDFWMEDCEDKATKSRHSALAYSKVGVHYCSTNNRLRAAEDRALKKCDKLVPRKMRKKAPCRIVASGDEIVFQTLIDDLRQDIRLPVGLEIYDGDTKRLQRLEGEMVFGESRSIEEHTLQILHKSGAPICKGTYEFKKGRVNFDMRCFGKFRFKDQKSKALGFFLYNGVYAPVFSAEFTRNDSYIKVSPPDAD